MTAGRSGSEMAIFPPWISPRRYRGEGNIVIVHIFDVNFCRRDRGYPRARGRTGWRSSFDEAARQARWARGCGHGPTSWWSLSRGGRTTRSQWSPSISTAVRRPRAAISSIWASDGAAHHSLRDWLETDQSNRDRGWPRAGQICLTPEMCAFTVRSRGVRLRCLGWTAPRAVPFVQGLGSSLCADSVRSVVAGARKGEVTGVSRSVPRRARDLTCDPRAPRRSAAHRVAERRT